MRPRVRTSRTVLPAAEVATHFNAGVPSTDALPESRRRLAAVADATALTTVALAVAALVAVGAREEGAYYVDVWAPLGLVLLTLVGALLFLRRAPALIPCIGAAALLSMGAWAVLSTQWGGIPNAAWTILGQSIVAAAALLAASALSVNTRLQNAVFGGVLLGLTGHALEILIRLAVIGGPAKWFFGRYLEGPVGYHNAQATLFVVGLPISLASAMSARVYVRAAGGAASGLLLGALMLTQSRGGLLAAGIAIVVLLAWARDLGLLLFSIPVLTGTLGLLLAVRRVDAALLDGPPADRLPELRQYVVWAGLVALALAATAAASARSRAGRRVAIGVAIATLAIGLAGGIHARGSIDRALERLTSSLNGQLGPDTAPAGATRLASLSLDGRLEAWRVAWKMTRETPLIGAGQGQFSRRWGVDRKDSTLYILQPHSLELELLGELGVVGLAAFALFVGTAIFGAATTATRHSAAITLSSLFALVGEVSVDWTWSFPAVVVPIMLLVGATSLGKRIRRPWRSRFLVAPCILVAAVIIAAPYLADRQLDRGRTMAAAHPDEAWALALDAHRLNPWDERPLALQGRLAEAAGRYSVAAARYDRSASLSRQPWVDYFREAAVWKKAGAPAPLKRACRLATAANPEEPLLRGGPCSRAG